MIPLGILAAATPRAGGAGDQYPAAVLALAPAYYYPCDDASGGFSDASGNGRHATLESGSVLSYRQASLRPNGGGKSAYFGGNAGLRRYGTYGKYPNTAWLAFWWMADFSSTYDYGCALTGGGSAGPSFFCIPRWVSGQLVVQFSFKVSSTSWDDLYTPQLTAGVPHFAVCAWSNTQKRIYIDGTLVTARAINRGSDSYDYSVEHIGQEVRGRSASYKPYIGWLQDIALGTGDITDAQVAALWAAAQP